MSNFPTPGFPPALETAIAEALLGHQWANMGLGQSNTCECGSPLDLKTYSTEDCWNAFCSHQAAVVMEVYAQHTTTEWGVRWEGSSDVDMTGHEATSREFVSQGADHGFVDVAVARLVLPWQEVKA